MANVNGALPKRGRPRSDRAKIAILEATRDQLASQGFERLSIQQVADDAGVGKQTIYRWWPTKRELVAECVLAGYVLPEGGGPADSGDLRADMRAFTVALGTEYGRGPKSGLLRALISAAAESDEVAAKLFERFGDPYRVAVLARLQSGQRDGQVRQDAPLELVADALVGALVFRVLGRAAVTRGELEGLADALVQGIAAPKPPRPKRK